MNSIITKSDVTRLHPEADPASVRTIEIVTDGSVGAQLDAEREARAMFAGPAYLSFRKSQYGELRFYFTDRQL